jgi:hypothetical protein
MYDSTSKTLVIMSVIFLSLYFGICHNEYADIFSMTLANALVAIEIYK